MFDRLVGRILKKEGKARGRIDVSLVDDKEIRKLNRRFRGKDKPTDVLAFSYDQKGMLGDVIISEEMTGRNAKKYGAAYRDELKRLVIHGVLHVLGCDHGRKMRHAEKVYAKF